MYIAAQRVISPSTGAEGVNAFYYRHGPDAWSEFPPAGIPDQNPGTLIRQSIAVPPPGNAVRSYLDIVAPDDTTWFEIYQAFVTFISHIQRQPFPWIDSVGRCYFRIGMEFDLASNWQRELATLHRAARAVGTNDS
jgi:hypothetical protein